MGVISDFFWDRCAYESWCVALKRLRSPDEGLFDNNIGQYRLLYPNIVYWYADPIVRKINGKYYVFTEAYNKWTGLGRIAVSEITGNRIRSPRIVLKEPFHLSFPEVFEYKDSYYMIPETHSVSEFRFYKMGDDVTSWKLYSSFPTEYEFSDTVVYNDGKKLFLLTTEKMEADPFANRLHLFRVLDFETPNDMSISEIALEQESGYGYDRRNGGSIVNWGVQSFRVIQESAPGFYGKGIFLYKILRMDQDGYEEEKTDISADLGSLNVRLSCIHKAVGVHTYGRCDDYEVIDIKTESVSLATLFNNLKKRFN